MAALIRRAALLLLLAGCGPAVLGIHVELVTKACPGATTDTDPLAGVDKLRFHLTGDGIEETTVTVDVASHTAQIPSVLVGPGKRRLTVEALTGGRVRSRADSGVFEAPGPGDVKLRLFLRTVDAFSGTADATAACTHMTTPRAGHAMALMPDGRVLISGGYSFDGSSPPKLVYHDDAEVFDPQAGTFTPLVPGPSTRRAGHAALSISGSSGQGILLAGGEGPADAAGVTRAAAVRPFDLFAKGLWTELTPTGPARAHPATAVDLKTGSAVIAGGQAGPDVPGVSVYDTVTYFDPATNASKDAALTLRVGPLTDAVAVARANLQGNTAMGGIVLVGGRDANGNVLAQISGLIWGPSPASSLDFVDDATFKAKAFTLPSPRAHHVALRTVDDLVLTAGGVTSLTVGGFDYSNTTAAITLIDPAGEQVFDLPSPLSQARADACALLLDDGTALVAGGAWKDAAGLHSARSVDLIGSDRSVRVAFGPPGGVGDGLLQAARHRAACLKLKDGSVLVTGGLQYPAAGGQPTVLDSAEIYQP
jgi:galactose oxidase-like protein